MNLKIGKVLTSISVGTGPSSYEKRIYRTAVSQRLRNTDLDHSATGIGHFMDTKTKHNTQLFVSLDFRSHVIPP